jgi:hypothetical protein
VILIDVILTDVNFVPIGGHTKADGGGLVSVIFKNTYVLLNLIK